MRMKISQEWANNNIAHNGTTRERTTVNVFTKKFDLKDTAAHKSALKLLVTAKTTPIENVFLS